MEIQQLRAFIHTARRGNVSAAARMLGLTQPTVTRRIQQLEREVGFALFDREQRPMSLTPAGREFLACAEGVVTRLDAAVNRLRGGDSPLEGPLLVAASTTPGEFLLPGLLATFTARHPGLRPSLLITDSADVVKEVLARRAEVGFVGAALTHRRLRVIPFDEDEILLDVPASHPFAGAGSVPLEGLAGQPLVEREGGSGTVESLMRLLGRHGLRLPDHRVAMVVGTGYAQLAAVEAGVGLGFVSSLALASRQGGTVVGVRIHGVDLRRTLYLVHEPALPSPAALAFVRFVAARRTARP